MVRRSDIQPRRIAKGIMVPIPCVENLEELNRQLLVGCRADQQRRIMGKPQVVGEAMQVEREHMLPIVEEGFELAEILRSGHTNSVDEDRASTPFATRTVRL